MRVATEDVTALFAHLSTAPQPRSEGSRNPKSTLQSSGALPVRARPTASKGSTPSASKSPLRRAGSTTSPSVSRCSAPTTSPLDVFAPSDASSRGRRNIINRDAYITRHNPEGSDYAGDEEASGAETEEDIPEGAEPVAYLGDLSREWLGILKWENVEFIDDLSSCFTDRCVFQDLMEDANYDPIAVKFLEKCIQADVELRIRRGTQGKDFRSRGR